MKKSIKLFGLLLSAPLLVGGLASAKVAMPADDPEPIVETVKECTVVVEENKHGKIEFSAMEGDVGEIITFTIDPKSFYLVESVSMNGSNLTAVEGEENTYSFALVSGENKIKVGYAIDTALLGEFAVIAEEIKAKDWKRVFSLENILLIVNYIINSGVALALVRLFSKYKYSKTVDRKEIIKTINDALPKEADAIIQKTINDNLVPLISPVIAQMGNMEEAMSTFIKAFLYSMEGTPDAKDKIITLLSGVKLSDDSTVNEIKKWLVEEINKIHEQSEKNRMLLEEMKKTNSEALARVEISSTPSGEHQAEEEILSKEDNDYDGTSI